MALKVIKSTEEIKTGVQGEWASIDQFEDADAIYDNGETDDTFPGKSYMIEYASEPTANLDPSTYPYMMCGLWGILTSSSGYLRVQGVSVNNMFTIDVSDSPQFELEVDGSDGTLIDEDYSVSVDQWFYVRMEMFIDSTSGWVKVWVGETLLFNETSVDTTGFVTDDMIEFSGNIERLHSIIILQKDSAFAEADYEHIINQYLVALSPTADASVEFTPSTGTDNYALIDEIGVDDDDYVYSDTDDDRDRYTLEDLSLPTNFVAKDLMVFARHRKETADDTELRFGIREDSVDELETAVSSDGYIMSRFYCPLDTGDDDWSETKINATELVIEANFPV